MKEMMQKKKHWRVKWFHNCSTIMKWYSAVQISIGLFFPPFEIWMHLLCNCDSLPDGCRAACLSHFGTDNRENKLQNQIIGDHLLTYPDLCESDSPSKEWQDIFVPLLLCCLLLVCSQRSVTSLPKALRFLFWNFINVRFKVIQNWYARLLCC